MRTTRNLIGLLAIVLAGFTSIQAHDPLPSWNDRTANPAIVDFVEADTEAVGAKFVPPPVERAKAAVR